jgi:hypothetical protein
LQKYKVTERVSRQVIRERTWEVEAISDQDAIRAVLSGQAAAGYKGVSVQNASRGEPRWIVDGNEVNYQPADAVPVDDGIADIGGGD